MAMQADPSPSGALTAEQQAQLSELMRQFQESNANQPAPKTPQQEVDEAFQALQEHQEPDSPYASRAYAEKLRASLEKLAALLGVRRNGTPSG